MYNKNVKAAFISQYLTEYGSTNKRVESAFDSVRRYEEEHGMDIGDFDTGLVVQVIDSVIANNSQVVAVFVYDVITMYIAWYNKRKLMSARRSILPLCKDAQRFMVDTPDDLQDVLDEYFDPVEDHTVDSVYRVLFWLAFMGVDRNEVFLVKKSDVDFGKKVVRFNGEVYPMYDLSIDAFIDAVNLTEFKYRHPKYSSISTKKRLESDSLLSTIKSGAKIAPFIHTIREKMSKRTDAAIDFEFNYSRLLKSGLFYRLYTASQSSDSVAPTFLKSKMSGQDLYVHENEYREWKIVFHPE